MTSDFKFNTSNGQQDSELHHLQAVAHRPSSYTVVPPLLSRPEAARYLGVKPQTLASWASTKRVSIPYLKVGRRVLYRLADLDDWLNTQSTAFKSTEVRK